jgi:hypothetical protein
VMYARQTLGFNIVNVHSPGWNENIFKWKFIHKKNCIWHRWETNSELSLLEITIAMILLFLYIALATDT